ncbi:glycoside hydrolase family 13 protein [Shouchella lonarensis]|uniref:Alpha-amylase n=1 Tax=Shouchella lonarensis TaxID=1464122 RepID=A0A1G6M7G1_9BACI|nr:alpha-glucosidase [Shouchella lonarensis]SDC51244.1 alpha-glucosidase [Shouchella lonarensis]
MKHTWWKEAICYQVYPRSFYDANGDGIGDIRGVIEKLDYLHWLGIDVIWLSPMYDSPNDDNGYDIRDYQAIMSEFGTMADFDELLAAVHARGMKLIIDLVINHTSDEHAWFVESRTSRNSNKRDWYIWRDALPDGREPNNWASIFNGSAWKWDEATNQYYLHLFSEKQPDLNWENKDVRHALYDMMRWWLDKGVDGFRVDAISHIKKVPGLPDLPNPNEDDYVESFAGHMNRPGIHQFLQEMKKETFDHYDIMTVGEANGVSIDDPTDADAWVGEENGVFHMVFQFEHLGLWGKDAEQKLDLAALKTALSKWQTGLEGTGWNALFLENHDQPRSVSTWGNDTTYWQESAKALGTLFFFMQGTPFIYQGQEIGMTNVRFPSIDDYDDVSMRNFYRIEREKGRSHDEIMAIIWTQGRDNARTPMQWSAETQGGFSTSETTWLGVNDNFKQINVVQQQNDAHSILHYYKQMISLRKQERALTYGAYTLVAKEHPDVFAYERTYEGTTWTVVVNMGARDTDFSLDKEAICRLHNYETCPENGQLRPYEARVYQSKK